MVDRFGRQIDSLRVSVTDRCNLHCGYCMPENVTFLPDDDVLSFEEVAEVVRAAAELDITRVRLTGGEPLLKRNIETLVAMIAEIDGIDDLAMSTNGTLLAEYAKALGDAGLHRVNVSLDATDPGRYAELTGGGNVEDVFEGIEAAKRFGLLPIKLNCVVKESSDESDARAVAAFARSEGLAVRFIREMNLAEGHFWVIDGGTGGHCAGCGRL